MNGRVRSLIGSTGVLFVGVQIASEAAPFGEVLDAEVAHAATTARLSAIVTDAVVTEAVRRTRMSKKIYDFAGRGMAR